MMIFDFDGPIADSFEGAFAVAQRISPALTVELYRERFQHNIHLVPGHLDLPKDETIDFDTEYHAYMATLRLDPNKHHALITLSQQYEFHIVSGSHTDTIADFLRRNRIIHLFTDVLGYDFGKSKVDRFEYLLHKHATHPRDVCFITDTTGDIAEARKVALGTIIAVLDGFHDESLLVSAQPTYCVDSLAQVPKLLMNQ